LENERSRENVIKYCKPKRKPGRNHGIESWFSYCFKEMRNATILVIKEAAAKIN
jgi:hypothetical protein